MPVYRHLLFNLGKIGYKVPDIQVTSWYRDPDENIRVGGSPDSQHLFGFAVDVRTRDPSEVVKIALNLGLYPVDEFDHVHIQTFPPGFLRELGFFA